MRFYAAPANPIGKHRSRLQDSTMKETKVTN
jgi:hypothetical protein